MMYRSKDLLGDEIHCPHCGSDYLFLEETYLEMFFEGSFPASCFCGECNGEFDLWFVVASIGWNDKEVTIDE